MNACRRSPGQCPCHCHPAICPSLSLPFPCLPAPPVRHSGAGLATDRRKEGETHQRRTHARAAERTHQQGDREAGAAKRKKPQANRPKSLRLRKRAVSFAERSHRPDGPKGCRPSLFTATRQRGSLLRSSPHPDLLAAIPPNSKDLNLHGRPILLAAWLLFCSVGWFRAVNQRDWCLMSNFKNQMHAQWDESR